MNRYDRTISQHRLAYVGRIREVIGPRSPLDPRIAETVALLERTALWVLDLHEAEGLDVLALTDSANMARVADDLSEMVRLLFNADRALRGEDP